MGADLCLFYFFEDNDEFKKKQQAFKACVDAGVEPPEELRVCDPEYTDTMEDAPGPVCEEGTGKAETEYRNLETCYEGYEIDLKKLPKGVRYIRAVIGW